MDGWSLWQYKSIVTDFLAGGFNSELRETLERKLVLLLEKGNELKMPHSEPIGGSFFSLHARKKKVRARLLYYFPKDQQRSIVVVHAFCKDTPAIARQDLDTAKARRKNIEEGRESAHGIDFTH